MKQLKQKVGEFDLLTDAGGYFKENDNLSNAKLLSDTLGKPSVFYNDHGDQAIWDGKVEMPFLESPLKEQEENRVTFLDQAHTTGADVTQKPRAIGLVTIGAKTVEKLGSTWIKPSFATADALYGQIPIEEESNIVRKRLRDKALESAKSLGLDSIADDIKTTSKRYRGSLPPIVSSKIGNEELTSEQQQQKIAEKQTELETISGHETGKVKLGEIPETKDLKTFTPDKFTPELYPFPSEPNPLPLFPLRLFFEAYPEFEPYKDCFEGIDISLGMLQIIDKKDVSLAYIAFFGQRRKEIKYMIIENKKITLLNINEAERRLQNGVPNIYELTIGYVNSKDEIDGETANKLTKIKFLAGKSNYTRQELNFLREWIEKEGVQKMYNLFTKQVLKGQVLKSQEYQQSSLQKLFQELGKT